MADNYICFSDNGTIILYHNKTELSTPLRKSYRCAKEQTFELMRDGSNKTAGAIELSHVQLEAFHEKMDAVFDAGWYPVRIVLTFAYSVYNSRLCTNKIINTHVFSCLFTIFLTLKF